MHSACLK
jgi:RING finger and CHY zinc finger domain-containing protein 1